MCVCGARVCLCVGVEIVQMIVLSKCFSANLLAILRSWVDLLKTVSKLLRCRRVFNFRIRSEIYGRICS